MAFAAAAFSLSGIVGAQERLPTRLPAVGFLARERDDSLDLPRQEAAKLRRDALARARAWRDPEVPVERADLRRNPDDPLGRAEQSFCRFHPDKSSGTTPKFECVFEGGEVLKVKYGRNPEIHTEVAATRLLRALGAGADRVYLLGTLRCFGCPDDPHAMLRCLSTPFEELLDRCWPVHGETTPTGERVVELDYGRYVDFGPVAVERRAEGKAIEADGKTAGASTSSTRSGPGIASRSGESATPCACSRCS